MSKASVTMPEWTSQNTALIGRTPRPGPLSSDFAGEDFSCYGSAVDQKWLEGGRIWENVVSEWLGWENCDGWGRLRCVTLCWIVSRYAHACVEICGEADPERDEDIVLVSR